MPVIVEPFTAASHHDVLKLLVQIGLLLFTARALGEISQRLGQPAVVGELLAGILLGPSLLSGAVPWVGSWILPQTEIQGFLLETVALIGVMFLLIMTGLETDLALIRRHARTALGVSWGGILVTFSTGLALGFWLPDVLLADPSRRVVFALFVATAMSISAIPVIAKVLIDMDLIRRDVGQTILAAGMNDDTIGWILLGIVAGLAGAGGFSSLALAKTVGSVLLFLFLSFTVGRWLARRSLSFVQDRVSSTDRLLTLVVILSFAWGAMTQALHLEPVLGAFVMGIIFGQMPRLPQDVHHKLDGIALGIFAPIFFAVAGLKVNAASLATPHLAFLTLVVIAIATLGKVAGTYLGARFIGGKDHWNALSYGAGLNARGALEIIIATVGLNLGILTQDMFSIIVVMAMVTSLMAPACLRFVLHRVEPSEEEAERLRREELAEGSVVANIHRVLLPIRLREDPISSNEVAEAALLERLSVQQDVSITLLTVVDDADRLQEAQAMLEELSTLFPDREVLSRIVEGQDPGQAILAEATNDYDLIMLGASEDRQNQTEVLFTPLVDYVVRMAPCPTMVVRGPREIDGWTPDRILVATDGSKAARNAAEFAFALNRDGQGRVVVLKVAEAEAEGWRGPGSSRVRGRQMALGHQIVQELEEMGRALGADVEGKVTLAPDQVSGILHMARLRGANLILLGTDVHAGSDHLYLGPQVERLLEEAPCPVVVLNT